MYLVKAGADYFLANCCLCLSWLLIAYFAFTKNDLWPFGLLVVANLFSTDVGPLWNSPAS